MKYMSKDYYNMDMKIDNMKMRRFEYKYKWKPRSNMIWISL
jgi:hypothetical protein